ncbi:MAG: terpene cyclase/mutase family protein [Planctomycetes bacterium]|nr:terpene cyclase/mutase family protein [Planctomycetota bacterium]
MSTTRHARQPLAAALGACALAALFVAACHAPATGEGEPKVHARPLEEAIRDGVAFLVRSQQPDGSWGTGVKTRGFEIMHSIPGSHDAFRVATTALAVLALEEALRAPTPFAQAKEAHARGLEYLVTHGEARRDTGDLLYNVWAHTYALQALASEMKANPDPRIRKSAEWHLDRLQRYETWMGGWFYYDFGAHTQTPSDGPSSFGAAAGLVALRAARDAGLDVPEPLVEHAVHRLEELRLPNGAYVYGDYLKYAPRHPANQPKGSLGRSQAGNFALWLWGSKKVGEPEARAGLDTFFREHLFIEIGRKRQYPHEAWYATAPYYFFFGHYYAARMLERFGDAGKAAYGARLAETILPFQEPDGSWWDYPLWDYDKPYGTAFAVMILLRCR